jgi:hypothetical protein
MTRYGVLLFAIAAILGTTGAATAAGPDPGLNVTVTNPPSAPVPVTLSGTSSVSGSVAVTNFPAVQKTRDILAPGQSPFTQKTSFNPSEFVFATPVTTPVPAGQRFIINYVSVVAFSQNTGFHLTSAACQVQYVSGPFLAAFSLASNPLELFWASENMFVVLNEGEQLGALCRLVTGAPASQKVDFTVSGYAVPVQ